MAHLLFFNAVLIAVIVYSMWRGGGPERAGAGIIIAGDVLTVLVARVYADRFAGIETGILIVDALMFAAFFLLALTANRFWPIWITGLQGVSVMVHGAMAIAPSVIPWAYAFGLAIWSYPILILLIAGTRRHRDRLARNGVDRSWSVSSGRWPPTRRISLGG